MSTELLTTETDGAVLWITLCRGDKRNPMSSDLIAALTTALNEAYGDDAVRCVVLAAEGPVFSSGHDLKELHPRESEGNDDFEARVRGILEACAGLMQGIVSAP